MKPLVDEVARKLRDALKESIDDFEGLYVFGSQVRGDATEDSDVDIVVLFEHGSSNLPDEYYEIMSDLMYDYYDIMDLDVLPYTRNELESNYFFHEEVVNKGMFYGTK
jgi:predicted nucleotidyltransferase